MSAVKDWFTGGDVSGWDLVLSALVLIGAWLLSRIARRWSTALLDKVGGLSATMRSGIVKAIRYGIIFLGAGVALSILGAPIQPLLTAAIIIGVVLALAMRGLADNFGSGIILQTRAPIKVGDEIESQSHTGFVIGLGARSVVIRTVDGRTVHLPNSAVLREPLINNSVFGRRRSEIEVRCAPSSTFADQLTVLQEAAATAPGVLTEPPPEATVHTVEPGRLTVRVRFWHDPLDRAAVVADVTRTVGEHLRAQQVAATVVSFPPVDPTTPAPAP